MIDIHVLRALFTTPVVSSVCLSICLSIYVTCSIHTETQPGRIFARSGLFKPHSQEVQFYSALITSAKMVKKRLAKTSRCPYRADTRFQLFEDIRQESKWVTTPNSHDRN